VGRDAVLAPVRGGFRAVTRAAVPAAAALDEAAWTRGEAIVEQALADRPARVRRQVVLFLRILELCAWLRFGQGLGRLSAEQGYRLMAWMERAPLLLLRRGVWGLRTLAFMAYYGQEEVRRGLGYAAVAGGWEARGSGQGPWSARGGAAPPEPGVLVVPPATDAHG
jgi:hypothetical protein